MRGFHRERGPLRNVLPLEAEPGEREGPRPPPPF